MPEWTAALRCPLLLPITITIFLSSSTTCTHRTVGNCSTRQCDNDTGLEWQCCQNETHNDSYYCCLHNSTVDFSICCPRSEDRWVVPVAIVCVLLGLCAVVAWLSYVRQRRRFRPFYSSLNSSVQEPFSSTSYNAMDSASASESEL